MKLLSYGLFWIAHFCSTLRAMSGFAVNAILIAGGAMKFWLRGRFIFSIEDFSPFSVFLLIRQFANLVSNLTDSANGFWRSMVTENTDDSVGIYQLHLLFSSCFGCIPAVHSKQNSFYMSVMMSNSRFGYCAEHIVLTCSACVLVLNEHRWVRCSVILPSTVTYL